MPFSLKTMKSIDLLCASPASTAITLSAEPPETPRISRGSRPLRRLNSLFSHREQSDAAPCTFETPFTPRATHRDKSQKSSAEHNSSMSELPFTPSPRAAFFSREKSSSERSSSSSSKFELPFTPRAAFFSREKSSSECSSKFELPFTPRAAFFSREKSRKSSAERSSSKFELPFTPRAAFFSRDKSRNSSAESSSSSKLSRNSMMTRRKSSADVHDLYGVPSSSSRYLLLGDMPDSNDSLGDGMIRKDDCLRTTTTSSLLDSQHHKSISTPRQQLTSSSDARSRASSTDSPALLQSALSQSHNQVRALPIYTIFIYAQRFTGLVSLWCKWAMQIVVLKVSIHCKGCEAKLRKHLSKLEGVTSFSIDLLTKKVTIIGNLTPSGVLTSISKVKNAQFWPSSTNCTSS
ncbi:hypothetical protein Dimus_009070 [Dionaea muscipula]